MRRRVSNNDVKGMGNDARRGVFVGGTAKHPSSHAPGGDLQGAATRIAVVHVYHRGKGGKRACSGCLTGRTRNVADIENPYGGLAEMCLREAQTRRNGRGTAGGRARLYLST